MSNKKSPEGLEKFWLIVSRVASVVTIAETIYQLIKSIVS